MRQQHRQDVERTTNSNKRILFRRRDQLMRLDEDDRAQPISRLRSHTHYLYTKQIFFFSKIYFTFFCVVNIERLYQSRMERRDNQSQNRKRTKRAYRQRNVVIRHRFFFSFIYWSFFLQQQTLVMVYIFKLFNFKTVKRIFPLSLTYGDCVIYDYIISVNECIILKEP